MFKDYVTLKGGGGPKNVHFHTKNHCYLYIQKTTEVKIYIRFRVAYTKAFSLKKVHQSRNVKFGYFITPPPYLTLFV